MDRHPRGSGRAKPDRVLGGVSMTERDAISFSAMLKRTRKQRGISSADLCAGICTEAMYSMIESGKREMNKTMRDRFLGRMGITTDGFEEYLKGDEYEVWMLRQRILDAVEDGHTGKARMLLKYYQELIDEDDCISRQFVHVVRGWTLHMKNASIRQRCKEYKAALLCTMPDCEPDHLLKLSLSLQEIAILLDYYSCIQGERESLSGEDVCHLIKKVMDYIEQKHFEDLAAAKIYPKAVVLLGDVVDKGGVSSKTASFLPEVCKKAIEMLRNTCRSYYAVEIIKLYLRYTGAGNIEFIMNTESPQRKEQDVTKQYSTWKEALTGIHEDAGLSAHTGSDTYLYRETEVYSIGEVINRRRIMLGMSKKKLADQALCSERTIKRIEDGEVKLQSGVFKDLFRVLGLPPEYSMMEIIAEHAGIIELINELKRYDEENDAAALRVLVKQIQEMAGYNEWNQQYLSFMECRLRYLEGKTNQDAYYHELKDVLGKTVPYERLSGSGYYTSTELLCIYHMAVTRRDNENDPHAEEKLLSEYYDSYKKTIGLRRMVNQYEMHATMLASTKGNRGEFDVSDRMGNDVIRICLSEHRLLQAYANVYNAFWNAREACKKRGGSMSKNLSRINQRRISQCIALSDFCKQTHAKRFYEERQ
ncbi:MAG: helix-turn-helix domain-containing protein [Lachnospiraceae bacterium]|nr:helix-turn-helix domain-containing protein [Lachnospiraceae bacterium]